MKAEPAQISVIVPARNAAETIVQCLDAIRASAPACPVIVVDDGSTDQTGALARARSATVIRLDTSGGPAAARNAGVRLATTEHVMFVDSDVVLAADAVQRVLRVFDSHPTIAAVFGSYDDSPNGTSIVSNYRNLLHHYVHQHSNPESCSFWAGCGAIRRETFLAVGGFDERYHRPSIEDIELGDRLAAAGHRIRLDKELHCTHLKEWTFVNMVTVDIRDRAYPWTTLILSRGRLRSDLSLQMRDRVSAGMVWVGLAAMLALVSGVWPGRAVSGIVVVLAVVATLVLNRGFYAFLFRRKGLRFVAASWGFHGVYYAYASATFAWCWARYSFAGGSPSGRRRRSDALDGSSPR